MKLFGNRRRAAHAAPRQKLPRGTRAAIIAVCVVLALTGGVFAAWKLLVKPVQRPSLSQPDPEPVSEPDEAEPSVIHVTPHETEQPEEEPEPDVPTEQPKALQDGVYNILICGTDDDGTRTDTIIIAHLDANDHTVALLSIPRDTPVATGGGGLMKINSVYAGGGKDGMERLAARLKDLLGFPVDGYVLVDLEAFQKTVDLVGGVEFDVPDDHLFPVFKGIRFYNHGPHIHEYLQEFRRDVLANYDCMTIAEAPLVTPQRALDYIAESDTNEIDMMIQFQCMCADCFFTDYMPRKFSLNRLRRAFSSWQTELDGRGWNALYLENHDHPRVISRYGSEQYRVESGKMLAVSYLFLKGTPFVYQGQEIGMTNWYPDKTSLYEDVQTRNQHPDWPEEKRLALYHRASRDSARTPVQWTGGENAGFTTGTPWFYVNENYPEINVEQALADPDSILNFYKKAIALRKRLPVVRDGSYQVYERNSDALYVYARETKEQKLLVVCSFTDRPVRFCPPYPFSLDDMKLLLCNYPDAGSGASFVTRPYEARVYLYE